AVATSTALTRPPSRLPDVCHPGKAVHDQRESYHRMSNGRSDTLGWFRDLPLSRRGTMKAAVTALALAIYALGCAPRTEAGAQLGVPTSQETILRESYAVARASGDDSTSYSAFKRLSTGDTASWAWTVRLWKASRALFSATLGRLGYGTGPFTW